MTLKILFCGYRDWAYTILDLLSKEPGAEILTISKPIDLTLAAVSKFKPDLIFIVGWSWKVPPEILKLAPAVGLHPSMLPKYRGGSPLQNQIIGGEKNGGVTLFLLSEKLDEGKIVYQEEMPLHGHLDEIFDRMAQIGARLFVKVMRAYPNIPSKEQDDSKASSFKRRKPEESELSPEDFKTKTPEELYNFIRALEDPYPNAFMRDKHGNKLLFKRAELDRSKSK